VPGTNLRHLSGLCGFGSRNLIHSPNPKSAPTMHLSKPFPQARICTSMAVSGKRLYMC